MKSGKKGASNKLGVGCLTLFGLPFAAVGAYMAYSLAAIIVGYYAAKSWVETPAAVLSTHLDESRNDDGDISYTVRAEYRYEFRGESYTSERVGLATGFESDKYDRRKHRELEDFKNSKQPTVCFVDPSNPEQALLDRALRPMVILFHLPFAICFSLVGFGMIGGALYVRRSESKRRSRTNGSQDEPWNHRADWAAGVIRSSTSKSLWATLVFAIFWNGLSLPIFAIVCLDHPEEWWVLPLVGLFPLIGVGLMLSFLHQLIRRIRFGRASFRMAHVPGVVGGQLTGVVLTPTRVRTEDGFRVKLACEQTVTRKKSDGDSKQVVHALWEDERIVDRTLHDPSGGVGVPIQFTIPSAAKPTDPNAKNPIAWKLRVTAKTIGPDFKSEFEAPVYRTEDSQEGVTDDARSISDYERVETLQERLAREGIVMEESEALASFRLRSPPARDLGTAALLGLISLVFLGVAVGFYLGMDAWQKWFVVVISGGIGSLLFQVTLSQLLAFSDLAIQGDQWRLRTGWIGLPGSKTSFTANQIKSVTTKQSVSSSSSSGESKQWNNVVVNIRGGKKKIVARGLVNRRTERALINELRRRAGLDKEITPKEDQAEGWSELDALPEADEP